VASTAYNPAANRLAEAFNKAIIKLLKQFVSLSRRDWNEKLIECLWVTKQRSEPLQEIHLFSLVMGVKQSYPRDTKLVALYCFGNQDDKWRRLAASPRARSAK